MTLNQLRYFRVLAGTEHYTKAADVLNIAQPSLSRAIALLEEELGVLLFTRRGRNVVLTDAGRAFLRYVETGLDTLDAGAAVMRDFRSGAERVSLGSITPVVNTYLPRMLGEYGVEPEIRGYSNEDSVLLSMVQAGLGVFISTDHPQMYSPDTVLIPLRQDRYRRYVYMVTRPGLAASTSAAQLIRYNQQRAVPERGHQPRSDGGKNV